MNRLYVVESTPTLTGAHGRPPPAAARRAEVEGFARALAARARRRRRARRRPPSARRAGSRRSPRTSQAHAGASAGDRRRDAAAGACTRSPTRSTTRSATSARRSSTPSRSRREPVRPARVAPRARRRHATRARSSCCSILGGNPVYTRRPTSTSRQRSTRSRCASTSASTTTRPRERCHWHVPEAHYLESWSDARAFDGTVTHRPAADRAALRRQDRRTRCWPRSRAAGAQSAYDDRARALAAGSAAAADFERALAHARCTTASSPGTALAATRGRRVPPGRGRARPRRRRAATGSSSSSAPTRPSTTAASPTTAGCRSCRKPLTKLTWDNAALVAPGDGASGSALADERRRRAARRRRARCAAPVLGPARATPTSRVTVHLGYGRTRAGRVGNGVGFNAYALRTSDAPWFGARRSRSRKTGRALPARPHAGPLDAWRAATSSARRRSSEYREAPRLRAATWRTSPPRDAVAVPATTSTRATRGAWRST